MKLALTIAIPALLILAGCADNRDDNLAYADSIVRSLQTGDFEGEIAIEADGRVGFGTDTAFWLGSPDSSIRVRGSVDFRENE